MSVACPGGRDTRRLWLIAALCGFLPPLLLASLGLYVLRIERERRLEVAADRLDTILAGVAARLDPVTHTGKRLKRLSASCIRPFGKSNERNIISYSIKYGIEPYLFDAGGAVRSPEGLRLRAKFVLRNLWTLLVSPTARYETVEEQKLRKTFCAVFGTDFLVSDLRLHEGVVRSFRVQRKEGYILWKRGRPDAPGDKSGCLLVIWNGPDQAALLKELVADARKNAAGGDNRLQLFVRLTKPGWMRISGQRIRRLPAEIRPMLAEKGVPPMFIDGRLWMRMETGNVEMLASIPVSMGDLGTARRGVLSLGCLAGFLALLLVRSVMNRAALRMKLAFVFVLASALPIAGLGFLGFRMLQDRRDTLVKEFENAGRELLLTIDREFDGESAKYLAEFRAIRDDAAWKLRPDSALASVAERIAARQIGSIELRDIYGKKRISERVPGFLEGVESVFNAFALACMEGALPPGRLHLENRPLDPMAKMIFDTPEVGFPFIISHPDTVYFFRFANRSLMWYWDVYRDPAWPFAYVSIAQPAEEAARRFLEKRLRQREARNGTAWRLMAFETSREFWLPSGIKPAEAIHLVAVRVNLTRQSWTGNVMIGRAGHGVIAVPGERLPGFTLVALYPESAIDREIAAGRELLYLAMGFILLIAFLTGGVLSDTFLVPVGELSRGLAALRNRTFDVALSSSSKDELGDLTSLFNTMAEKLRQMSMARSVQEALIPEILPHAPGWDFDIFNLTASDLGGDYCDLIPLRNGTLLFLLGDITGHGAGSALLMVMVKAAVTKFAETGTDPEELMNALNRLIFRLVKRRKMMTCVIGTLDPESGHTLVVNAGHPYPFKRVSAGDVEEIHSVGFPLGLNEKKLRLQPTELTLEPGDTLVVYTDGLVEGMDEAGTMFGYERIHTIARMVREGSAKAIREAIVSGFTSHHRDPKLEDDLTMIVLRRHA
ncbi:MAG TPA: SpoIIE family protein phosphatase [Candidatus Ozemobacteraceae bacterium]|nr:SpoIIE family protein phosphatase [Candidatus Ozemobacteraceae bacterium]